MNPPEHILARRLAQRRRRRRNRAAALAALVLAIATAAVLVLWGGRPRSVRAQPLGLAASAPAAQAPVPRLRPALAREIALGTAHIRALAALGLPVFCGARHGHEVALTFDDGPGVYTYLALRKLRRYHERATFFLVGRSMSYFPGWARRELAVAALGDHTATHADLAVLGPAQVQTEIQDARTQIAVQSGRPVYLFRPPYGAINPTVLGTARRLGLLTIMWTADSGDSLGANYAGIIHNVAAALHPGAIILMHENRGQTIRALSTLLPLLRRRHLRSVSLPELFAHDAPSVAQLRRGQAACPHAGKISYGSN